jgi:dTDP-4-dehydrorhamnose reductase
MKILLTGAGGQIGWELQKTLIGLGEVVSCDRTRLDLSDPDQIRTVVREVRPGLIVNAAAYTAVDRAEDEPDLAMAVNGTAPGILAEEAGRLDALLVHYSTDYVFDGRKTSGPFTEDDSCRPINTYGKTKLQGERNIIAVGSPHLILRTSWVYGLRGKNFLLTMQKAAREKPELRVVDDQIGTPTWCRSIAKKTRELLNGFMTIDAAGNGTIPQELGGIYHLTCEGQTSWFGFAKAIIELMNLSESPQVIPISTAEFPTPAPRPRYSVLSNEKIRRAAQITLPHWNDALRECLSLSFRGN